MPAASTSSTGYRREITRLISAALCCLLILSASVSQATPIEYSYSGVITSADSSTGVAAGTQFSGMFVFDPAEHPTTVLSIEGNNQYAFGQIVGYSPAPPPDLSGLSLQVGGAQIYSHVGALGVSVSELEYAGQYGYGQGGTPAGPYTTVGISNENIGDSPLYVSLSLSNSSRSVFGSLAVPTSLNLADFPQARLDVTESTNLGLKTLYSGTIESLSVVTTPTAPAPSMLLTHGYDLNPSTTAVPEPASLTLFCIAAVSLAAHSLRGKAGRARESSPS